MFYHYECLKKGGRFYLCWVANTWPKRFSKFTASRIKRVNVAELCDDLLEVINTESFSPSRRFSLRLSCQLVMGLLKIYDHQVRMFTYDLLSFDSAVNKGIKSLQQANQSKKVFKKRTTPANVAVFTEPEAANNAILTDEQMAAMMNNTVVNVSTITLPDNALLPHIIINDGFGEEIDQMLAFDATVEQVRGEVPSVVEVETSTFNVKSPDKLTDRTISEMMKRRPFMLDVTVERPLDAITDVSMMNLPEIQTIPDLQITPVTRSKRRQPVVGDIVLEPLEDNARLPPVKRKRRSLIFDSETKLSSQDMMLRLRTPNIELRCQFPSLDCMAVPIRLHNQWLMSHPAGQVMTKNNMYFKCSQRLMRLFNRNLITRPEPDFSDKVFPVEKESVRAKRRTVRTPPTAINQSEHPTLPPILEQSTQRPMENILSPAITAQIQDGTLLPDITQEIVVPELELGSLINQSDIIDETNRTDEKLTQTKKGTSSQIRSPRITRQKVQLAEETADVMPHLTEDNNQVMVDLPRDVQEVIDVVENIRTSLNSSSGNGSCDRTQVSLGDKSSIISQTKEFLDMEWEPPELLKMINRAKLDRVRPLTFEDIIMREYNPHCNVPKVKVACRAFASILRLKKHGFVKITKFPDTIEIGHIRFGDRLKEIPDANQ